MHEDDVVRVRQRVQPEPYGLLARLTAGHDQEVRPLGQRVRVEQALDLGRAVGRRDHHDEGDPAGGGHRPDRVHEHGRAAQRAEGFRCAGAEPYARPAAGITAAVLVFVRVSGRMSAGEGRDSSDIGSCQVCVLDLVGYGLTVPGATP